MKSNAEKKTVVLKVHHPHDLKGTHKVIGGSMSDDWNDVISGQVINAFWTKHLDGDEANKLRIAAVEALIGIKPKDEIEGMIGAQLIACHNASMECFRRAMLPDISFDVRHGNLKRQTSYRGRMRHWWNLSIATGARASKRSRSNTSTSTKVARPSSATSRVGVGLQRN